MENDELFYDKNKLLKSQDDVSFTFGSKDGKIFCEKISTSIDNLTDKGKSLATRAGYKNEVHLCIDSNKNIAIVGTSSQDSSDSKGCYIATVCYGDINTPQIILFKRFRDDYLLKFPIGIYLVNNYYKFSPYLAAKLRDNSFINKIVKYAFLDVIYFLLRSIMK